MSDSNETTSLERARLAGLLAFGRGLLAASTKTLMDMRAPGLGCFLESELSGVLGLSLDQEDGVWLKLQRQQASRSPIPDQHIREWFDGNIDDPKTPPLLKSVLILDFSIEEASELCDGGLVFLDDIHEHEPSDEIVRLALRLCNLSERRVEIEEWIASVWSVWAEKEQCVRNSIAVYEQLFRLYNQMHGGTETPPEFVWGMGMASWHHNGLIINKPVLEQLVDLELRDDGVLMISPRDVPVALDLRPFHEIDPGAGQRAQAGLEQPLRALVSSESDPVSPFAPACWEPLLSQAASLLASDARLFTRAQLGSGEKPSRSKESLEIASVWALYARPRTTGALEDDLRQLGEEANDASGSLAEALFGFVREPSTTVDSQPDAPTVQSVGGAPSYGLAGEENSSETASIEKVNPVPNYYFPLPFNEEQGRIIDQLEKHPVVTVTGPPGTGKTHTIANIVCHYMSIGRRVLVTARTAEAIAAVREKLPKELAVLVIASVGSDREGTRQLEEAVERLSDEVVSLDEAAVREEAERLEAKLLAIDVETDELDLKLSAIAQSNLEPLHWQGEERTAMDVASRLALDASSHDWFDDQPDVEPPSTLDAVIDELRQTIPTIANDVVQIGVQLPDITILPSSQALIAIHAEMREKREHPDPEPTTQPTMARDTSDADERAASVLSLLYGAREKLPKLESWIREAITLGIDARCSGQESSAVMNPILTASSLLEDASPRALVYDCSEILYAEFEEAIFKGCETGKPVSLVQRMSKKDLVRAIESVFLEGSPPANANDWRDVRDSLRIEAMRTQIEELWNNSVEHLSLPSLPESLPEFVKTVRDCANWHDRIERAAEKLFPAVTAVESLFPVGLEVRAAFKSNDFTKLITALEANLVSTTGRSSTLDVLQGIAAASVGSLAIDVQTLHDSIGRSDVGDQEIVTLRSSLTHEIDRITSQQPALDRVVALLDILRNSGAPVWADLLVSHPGDTESNLRTSWRESWAWAVMSKRIDGIIALGNGDDLLDRKRELAADRQQRLRQLIRAKTLLGLKPRMNDEVRSALQAFTIAVRRLGKGTGANAPRWRRAMREEAMKASRAAPVWIMPEYKVSEQLPSLASSFDLVVLDEASQCDVTSLASLARGVRCLIVGDEKQVSPSSVGLPTQRINTLREEFLSAVPARNLIDQNTSIFDLATQMYPSSHLMLKEHFRCVEPIIRYSSRFYQDRLIPLRVPKASERFDPPLVELHVAGASRDGVTNPAEATVIVDEIAAIVQNPIHAWRGIAVISLIGSKQADLIERRLMSDERIGTEAMKRHNIICGDARTLQGQERSVVFLSMVAIPDSVRSQSTKDVQQRMNVAMSRACDRLYLARSVSMSDLKPGDIKADVLKHFRDPMPEGGSAHDKSVLELCESGFERDVCKRLMDANYRTRAQVRAGPFSIDLVVEGADDRRLAIELDGDHWHGPDVWHRDMRRQSSLERAGWTFWRVFGSQWISNQDHHWNDLVATLGRLGIEPIGGEASAEVFSETRRFVVDGNNVRLRDVGLINEDEIELVGDASKALKEVPVGTTESAINFDEDAKGDVVIDLPTDVSRIDLARVSQISYEVAGAGAGALAGIANGIDNLVQDSQVKEAAENGVDEELSFYDDAHRPILLERIISIIDDTGPLDYEVLVCRVAEKYGLKRSEENIRDSVSSALDGQRVVTVCSETEKETVWPDCAIPTDLISWEPGSTSNLPDWDQLSAPVRAGLSVHVLTGRPSNFPQAVLELIHQDELTERLVREIKASRIVAECHMYQLSNLKTEN